MPQPDAAGATAEPGVRDTAEAAAAISRRRTARERGAAPRGSRHRSTRETSTACGQAGAGGNNAARCKSGPDRGSCPELRSAGHQAVSDPRTENAETEQ